MTNNDLLRQLRYALNLSDRELLKLCNNVGAEIDLPELLDLLKKEDESGFRECDRGLITAFLDGLVASRRGGRQSEEASGPPVSPEAELTNNDILKKLRVALELKEEDLMTIMRSAGTTVSRSELSALFRSRGHKNYKPCGDQFLRLFVRGLTIRLRGAKSAIG